MSVKTIIIISLFSIFSCTREENFCKSLDYLKAQEKNIRITMEELKKVSIDLDRNSRIMSVLYTKPYLKSSDLHGMLIFNNNTSKDLELYITLFSDSNLTSEVIDMNFLKSFQKNEREVKFFINSVPLEDKHSTIKIKKKITEKSKKPLKEWLSKQKKILKILGEIQNKLRLFENQCHAP